jgi:hypothetical protein
LNEYSGSALHVAWITSAGTATLTGKQRTFRTSETADEIDATGGSDQAAVFLPKFTASEASISVVDTLGSQGTAGTATWAALAPQVQGTLKWYPEGTAAGNQVFTQAAVALGRDREFPYDNAVTWDARWRLSGSQTMGTA